MGRFALSGAPANIGDSRVSPYVEPLLRVGLPGICPPAFPVAAGTKAVLPAVVLAAFDTLLIAGPACVGTAPALGNMLSPAEADAEKQITESFVSAV